MNRLPNLFAFVVLALFVACSSQKGSTYLKSSSSSSTSSSTVKTPKVKASETTASTTQTAQVDDDLEARICDIKETVENAKSKAEATVDSIETAVNQESSVVVKEEKVTIVESSATEQSGKYHIIIGSFKQLENARNLSSEAVKEGFLPSIMENEDGLYRVAVFTGDEQSARNKLAEMRETNKQYVGMWLLVQK